MDDNLPPPQFCSDLREPNFVERMSKTTRKLLEWGILLLAFGFFFCQLYLTRQSVLEVALADTAPIKFSGPWRPDKRIYAPGEMVKFKYVRTTVFDNASGPLLAFSVDSFENKTNGEVYRGALIGRVIDKPGTVTRYAVTTIPAECSDGEYVFEGWIRAETIKRSLPMAFRSQIFTVAKPK